jgi:hypothetical protein
MSDLIDRIPAPIRSLWNAEVELRRGIWASILKRDQPNPHYAEARRHFDEAVNNINPPTKQAKWGSEAHTADTVEQRRKEADMDRRNDQTDTPRP